MSGEKRKKVRIIITGGGTGGHLFPGIAIIDELNKRYGNLDTLFIIGRRKIEGDILLKAGFETKTIDVEGLKGRSLLKMPAAFFKIFSGLIQSFMILRNFKPCLVIGLGGYSSGPVGLCAWFLGIPVVLHEQNTYPGLTNRLLARFSKKIFISFEESRRYLKKGNLIFSGNPVREELLQGKPIPSERDKVFAVLVMGGSLGARSINRAAISTFKELQGAGLLPFVIHQTGMEDLKKVAGDYERLGIKAEVRAFIDDMPSAYERADLVICRAGATTIAELAVLGKPSILIPYPYAANNHQEINAGAMVSGGAAEMVLEKDLNGSLLAAKIRKYMENGEELKKMSAFALKAGNRQAKEIIADELVNLIKGRL